MKKTILLWLIIIFAAWSVTATAQQSVNPAAANPTVSLSPAVNVIVKQLDSKLMKRQIPYKIILPLNYEADQTTRFPVLYLLHGLGGNYKDWTEKTKLVEYAAEHRFIIVTAEGGNGWYTDSVSKPEDKYESYIIQELIPEVDKNYRTIVARSGRAIGGLSMGGYGATKFGLKYPEKFVFAASLSGAVSIASWKTTEQIPPMFRQMIISTFGDEKNVVKKSNDLFAIFADMPADKIPALPFFYLDCGTEDQLGLLEFNQYLAGLLRQRKIPHEFRELPGKHNWDLWGQQIQDVLRISERIFNPQPATTATAAN